jgi:hypothetical protein
MACRLTIRVQWRPAVSVNLWDLIQARAVETQHLSAAPPGPCFHFMRMLARKCPSAKSVPNARSPVEVLGGVAMKVVRLSPDPVLTVREPSR